MTAATGVFSAPASLAGASELSAIPGSCRGAILKGILGATTILLGNVAFCLASTGELGSLPASSATLASCTRPCCSSLYSVRMSLHSFKRCSYNALMIALTSPRPFSTCSRYTGSIPSSLSSSAGASDTGGAGISSAAAAVVLTGWKCFTPSSSKYNSPSSSGALPCSACSALAFCKKGCCSKSLHDRRSSGFFLRQLVMKSLNSSDQKTGEVTVGSMDNWAAILSSKLSTVLTGSTGDGSSRMA